MIDATTANPNEALRLLGVYTGGYFRLDRLTGPAKRSCRKHILEALRGSKVKSTECGITALESALFAAFYLPGDCPAERHDGLTKLGRERFPDLAAKLPALSWSSLDTSHDEPGDRFDGLG